MSDRNWKAFFALAAIFNVAVGAPMLLTPVLALGIFGLEQPPTLLFVQFAGGAIVMFGLFYAVVARDLARREVVVLGAVGKLFAVALLTIYKLAGEIPDLMFYLGLGDLAFATAFLWFVFGGRKASRA